MVARQQIVELLRTRGNPDWAEQARSELPEEVDPNEHADLLSRYGIYVNELLGNAAGGSSNNLAQ